jgi:predicted nuclease of restriction endonuclease-like (RecB) superfamily
MLFERTAIALKPEEQIRHELKNLAETKELSPDMVFKNTYVVSARKLHLFSFSRQSAL